MNSRGTGQDGADRRAQPLGEIEPDRIDIRGEGCSWNTGSDGRIEQPRSVHMEAETAVIGQCSHLLQPLQGPDRATATIGRVLDRDECRSRRVGSALAQEGTDLIDGEDPARSGYGPQHDTGQPGRSAGFRLVRMRFLVEDHRLAAVGVETESDGVAHRARGKEEGRVLAQQRGGHLLELVDRRVFAQLLVADRSGRHELTHRRRRSGLGITGEIDHQRLLVRRAARPDMPAIGNATRLDMRVKLDRGSTRCRRDDSLRDSQVLG